MSEELTITTIDGREFKPGQHIGAQLVVIPVEHRPSIPTEYGVREAYKVDVVALEDGLYYENVLLFNKALVRQVKETTESKWLVTLTETEAKTGHERGTFLFEDPSVSGIRLAARYGF